MSVNLDASRDECQRSLHKAMSPRPFVRSEFAPQPHVRNMYYLYTGTTGRVPTLQLRRRRKNIIDKAAGEGTTP